MRDNDSDTPARNLSGALPVLPGASQAGHLTISGGSLGGLDVVRVNDMGAAGTIEVGARVELKDGRGAEVVEVSGRLLTKFGVLPGSVKVRLENGNVESKSSQDIARVLTPPS
jgi:hypothetical protein